jgi:carbon starvation protein CstA
VFWPLFGASNQLLAAIGLLGITVWLHRTYQRALGLADRPVCPQFIMYIMSGWALLQYVTRGFVTARRLCTLPTTFRAVGRARCWLCLPLMLLWEAVKVFSEHQATLNKLKHPR